MGLPVTCLMESAPPPRASPSIFDMMTPSKSTRSAKAAATFDDVLAGHGVHHHEDLVGLHRALDVSRPRPSCSSSTCRRPGRVDDDHVAQVVDGVLDALLGDAPPGLGRRRGTRARRSRRPRFRSWSAAAGRYTSHATSSGRVALPASGGRPAWRRRWSCRSPAGPRSMMTLGMRLAPAPACCPCGPAARSSSSSTILTTFCAGVSESEHLGGPGSAPCVRATNALTTLKLTSASRSAMRISRMAGVDVVLGQAALAAQAREDALQAFGKAFEHGRLAPCFAMRAVAFRQLYFIRPPRPQLHHFSGQRDGYGIFGGQV